jgi:DNA-binding transcriptional ArsR family regulator
MDSIPDDVINYYAVIPAEVRYSEDLNASEKLLYGEISALASKSGYCWAGNSYFAELYGVGKTTVSRWLRDLKDAGFINMSFQKDAQGKVQKRYISITPLSKMTIPPYEKSQYPLSKNDKENNTSKNNTSINKKEIYKEKDEKLTFGEFRNVKLTPQEYDKLKDRFFNAEARIETLSAYKASTGKRYKSDYATILNWARKEENIPKKEERKEGDVYSGF